MNCVLLQSTEAVSSGRMPSLAVQMNGASSPVKELWHSPSPSRSIPLSPTTVRPSSEIAQGVAAETPLALEPPHTLPLRSPISIVPVWVQIAASEMPLPSGSVSTSRRLPLRSIWPDAEGAMNSGGSTVKPWLRFQKYTVLANDPATVRPFFDMSVANASTSGVNVMPLSKPLNVMSACLATPASATIGVNSHASSLSGSLLSAEFQYSGTETSRCGEVGKPPATISSI